MESMSLLLIPLGQGSLLMLSPLARLLGLSGGREKAWTEGRTQHRLPQLTALQGVTLARRGHLVSDF